ncbi:hypothetical protein [Sphingomonas sp.]|uniref:hypothetical protein n=1 Tax=Sphingomonas sp. TaxID=28214 RepID=UPI001B029009|nr:hypothetical protein [Sphingomonas sp.]MBO9713276.1 hypothetical protein [Sphingomonas sp.]
MKGKVLGFTPSTGTGTISGEDGARYGFGQGEWRSDKPIAAGIAVDFEPRGKDAVDIYPVAGASIDVGALGASPAVAKAKSLAMGTLPFPLAIILLIACFLPAINSAGMGGRSLSLLGLSPVVSELNERVQGAREMSASRTKSFDEREAQIQEVIAKSGPSTPVGFFGSGPTAGQALKDLQDERAKADDELAKATSGAFLLGFIFLVYAVPVLALAVAGLAWTGRLVAPAAIAAGASGVVAYGLLWNVSAMGTSYGGVQMLTLGFGAWVLLGAGIALILAGLGKIRNPLASA